MRSLLLALLIVFPLILFCQDHTYKNLVFEGAGIRGLAYAGALMELEQNGTIHHIEKVGGTSAGAIIATAISLGYSGNEVESLVSNMKAHKFNDGRLFFFGGLYRVNKFFGWYRGDKFEKWISEFIEIKTGNPDITFAQLSKAGYKDLYITGTSLNRQELLVFSKETYPDMKIKDAVRASMSIPLYFKAVFIDEKGHVIEKPKKRKDLDLIVDGGITGNFPIHIFDSIYIENGYEIIIPNPQTLGLRIDTDVQIEHDKNRKGLAPASITNLKEYIVAFYNYTMESLNRNQLTPDDWNRTISISSAGIGPKIKKLSPEQKKLLVENGKKGVRDFFKES